MTTVLLDCDGVLADFTTGLIQLAERIGVPWKPRKGWNQFAGLSRKHRKALDLAILQPGFCRSLPVLPGAQAMVAGLNSSGHEVYAVTAFWDSHPTWCAERVEYLHAHFDIPGDHVVLTKAKHLVDGDLFVDDRVRNVNRWSQAHPGRAAMLATWGGEQWMTPADRTWFLVGFSPAEVLALADRLELDAVPAH